MLYVITQDGLGIIPVPKYSFVYASECKGHYSGIFSGIYRIENNGADGKRNFLGVYTGKDQAQRVLASLAGAMAGANRKMMVFTMPEDKKE